MGTHGLPDIHPQPWACGPQALGVYIRQTTLVHVTTTVYGKMFEVENFANFTVSYSIAKLYPRIIALSIGNKLSLQACYRESFPANNHFPL